MGDAPSYAFFQQVIAPPLTDYASVADSSTSTVITDLRKGYASEGMRISEVTEGKQRILLIYKFVETVGVADPPGGSRPGDEAGYPGKTWWLYNYVEPVPIDEYMSSLAASIVTAEYAEPVVATDTVEYLTAYPISNESSESVIKAAHVLITRLSESELVNESSESVIKAAHVLITRLSESELVNESSESVIKATAVTIYGS